jgi:nucleoside 2-deoxyribosyltransferase
MLYIFTRLFAPEDRKLSVEVEAIALEALKEAGLRNLRTFVPYRDTDQETIVVGNKAKYIYDADVQRLEKSRALLGFLNGMSKDEGICFELGYAYATRVPTFVGVTDFFNIGITGKEVVEVPLDPVLLCMITKLVHFPLGDALPQYGKQQELQIRACIRELASQMATYLQEHKEIKEGKEGIEHKNTNHGVYLEFAGGQYEWAQIVTSLLREKLGKVLQVKTSQRLDIKYLSTVRTNEDVLSLGKQDLENLRVSEIVVICADSAEMDAGSAALQGYARGLGKFVILYDSKSTLYSANGGHVMSRNLMLDQSASYIAKTINEVAEVVLERIG